jgi:tetratricopeptide (TPR) repeat protein
MFRKFVVLGGLLGIVQVLAQQPTQAPQQPAAVQLQRAMYAQNTSGDLDSAISEYHAIIASNPSRRDVAARAQYRLAQALLQKGDLAAAAQEFQTLASDYGDYKDLIKSMASMTAVFASNPQIGTFENGRYHHNLSGIEFNAPSGWKLTYQGPSSGGGEQVAFRDPQSEVEVLVWMKPDGAIASKIDDMLDHDQARKHEDREEGWTLRLGSVRRTVGGQKALSATADISEGGHPFVEQLTWVRSTSCRAQFWGEAPVEKLPILQNALEQMMSSAEIP